MNLTITGVSDRRSFTEKATSIRDGVHRLMNLQTFHQPIFVLSLRVNGQTILRP